MAAEAEEVEGDEMLLGVLAVGMSERNALIFILAEEAALSYSSMRLTRSSSDLMDTRASRSSVGS